MNMTSPESSQNSESIVPAEVSGLAPNWLRQIVWQESTASTNQLAQELLVSQQLKLPALVTVQRQTAGRGRLGRSWFADEGGLAVSLVLSTKDFPARQAMDSRIALVTGIAVAEAIELSIPPIRALVKWPNDVYVAGRKVAGILVEVPEPGQVVVGIGINVANDLSAADDEVRQRATTLSLVSGRTLNRWAVLHNLVERVQAVLHEWQRDPGCYVKLFRQRCFLTGKKIRVQHLGDPLSGECRGINLQGELVIVDAAGKTHQIIAGDVSW